MTDEKSAQVATSSGPIAQELANWLREIRSGWTKSLPEPLPVKSRRFYAFAGSFTWMGGFVFAIAANPTLASLFRVGALDVFGALGAMSFYSLWFGWLVAFSERKAGPVRLFLDGLLLPTVTVSIIAFAMGRIVQMPPDLPASSQSRGITLGPGNEGTGRSADTSAPDPEEAGGESQVLPRESENEEAGSSEPPN